MKASKEFFYCGCGHLSKVPGITRCPNCGLAAPPVVLCEKCGKKHARGPFTVVKEGPYHHTVVPSHPNLENHYGTMGGEFECLSYALDYARSNSQDW